MNCLSTWGQVRPSSVPQPMLSFTPGAETPYTQPAEVFKQAVGDVKSFDDRSVKVEDIDVGPFLETVIGVKSVLVRNKRGEVRVLLEGHQLQFGDAFLTGPTGFVRVAFEQGAQALIPPESHIVISQVKNGQGFIGTPMLEVQRGEVRILVEQRYLKKSAEIYPRKHRFIVRTPSALVGVRGTDFVVFASPNRSVIHTMTGVVDIANGLKPNNLELEDVVSVPGAYGARVIKGIPDKAEHYVMTQYIKEFNKKYPFMESMWKAAAHDSKTGRVALKFVKAREQKTKELNQLRKENTRLNEMLRSTSTD